MWDIGFLLVGGLGMMLVGYLIARSPREEVFVSHAPPLG
jgi:hypothetical protein